MTIEFAPLLPIGVIVALAIVGGLLFALGLYRRVRGVLVRGLALAAVILALVNPVLQQEDREPLDSIVVVVVDRSQSQLSPQRQAQTDAALSDLTARLGRYPNLDVQIVDVSNDPASDAPSTRLFEALQSSIQDVPPSRMAGAIFITDGQIHDAPESLAQLGFDAPVHGLITGQPNETDRRIEIVRAPRFGIVGEDQEIIYRILDEGRAGNGLADVTIRLNGTVIGEQVTPVGREVPFVLDLPRGGHNIIELSVESLAGEISQANNQAVTVMEGIRENLRVLLVSGEPHSGERAWRNLLKSDASVDLVHFTILRPPEKQDGTPIDELSLIAFPTRELFVEKISEFDLIVFDRYQRRGVLPVLYYDYIAQYVEEGGALLIAAGPEHASRDSIATTPLAPILPASPTGAVREAGFYPRLSEDGRKHPVTRDLPGSTSEPPGWGRWFRAVEVSNTAGNTVMNGPDGTPLLVLNRYGEGRIAMLMSDHGWLWARGFEGGGPHVALYRRIAHWLMQEPALEEEALTATAIGRTLRIERQTMADMTDPVTIRLPSGEMMETVLEKAADGLFRADIRSTETGLFKMVQGAFTTLAHVGAVNAPEFRATISRLDVLEPLAGATGGLVTRLASASDADRVSVPAILPVRGTVRGGSERLVVRMTDETVLVGVNRLPLFAGFLGLALLLAGLMATWYREGR